MFLGVATNQEIMDVLQALNNKSIWEITLSVIAPIAASIITLWLSNKHSEKQLVMQLRNERQKIKEDRDLQLKIEEKEFIDKEVIENLSKIASLLYPALDKEVFFNTREVYRYYKALEKGADEESEKKELRKTYNASASLMRKKQLEINILISFASPALRDNYRSLTKEMLNFEYGTVYNQYSEIYNTHYCNPAYPMLNTVDFIDEYENYSRKIIDLVTKIQKELDIYVDNAKNLKNYN